MDLGQCCVFFDKIRRKNVRIARCKPLSSTLWSKQGCYFAQSLLLAINLATATMKGILVTNGSRVWT